MNIEDALNKYRNYFNEKIETYGAEPRGVDYNGPDAQIVRFEQLIKLIDVSMPFSILDFGCGYGALFDFLKSRDDLAFEYFGFDMLEKMIEAARDAHANFKNAHFTAELRTLVPCDYLVAGAIFNNKFQASEEEWISHIFDVLRQMNTLCTKGFSFNMLTKYSDAERMAQRPDLFFGDPRVFFDFCKRNVSRRVALLEDYGLYDFTILVRKPA